MFPIYTVLILAMIFIFFLPITDFKTVRMKLAVLCALALVAADALKVDFVHHVSYELRSPLTNIIGFGNLLSEPSTGPLTDNALYKTDSVYRSGWGNGYQTCRRIQTPGVQANAPGDHPLPDISPGHQ